MEKSVATANGFEEIKSIKEGTSTENSRVLELSNERSPNLNIQSKSLKLDAQTALEQFGDLGNLETDRGRRATVNETLDMNTKVVQEDDFCNFDEGSPEKQEILSKFMSSDHEKYVSSAPN